MTSEDRYTLSYRSNEAHQVMEWIQAGQCGSIIGLRGAGKSNFLHFLLREDVRRHYLGQNADAFHFILVDFLSLAEGTDWGVYETLLHNVVKELRPPGWENTIIGEISALHQEIIQRRDALIAQRAFERCVALMSQPSTRRLVFIFDEFDAVFRELPAALFRCLRAIRDAHKDQISFIVVSIHELADLRDGLVEEVDHFHRLVSRNICWLGPYNEMDAREMIGYLTARRSRVLNDADTTHLIELSGGHAGLLKASLSLVWNSQSRFGLKVNLAELINEPSIRRECRKIWENLSDDEKAALCSLARREPIPSGTLLRLADRGLVRKPNSDPIFFSVPFCAFVKEQAPPPTRGTYINRSTRLVQIDGRHIQGLTELEFELLCYLYEQHGRVCTKYDLIENVYRQQYNFREGGLTDQMLQALISRLREKIEPDRSHPKYVVTVRGEGYTFVMPGEDP